MATGWLLQTIYAALLGQTMVPTDPPTTPMRPDDLSPNWPIVRTVYGDLRGFQQVTPSGVVLSTFLGIPFASPPVGNLRFNRPAPPLKWSGVRDASQFGHECLQNVDPGYYVQLGEETLPRTEDCLYLNVYKPESKPGTSEPLPVMVWIHGGGFIFGAGSTYDASELAANGVIVVTINYRLEVFGFLSNDDDVIPGNYGMLDQVMALKWVKDNIGSFGGDPDKVTIFGESAGSASVSYLVLSPLAKGLFQRAIMESGTSLSTWGFQFPAARVSPSQITNLIGAGVGCNEIEAVKKLECLRNVDGETLLNTSLAVGRALRIGITLRPVVETKFGFLPDRPVNLWRQGKFNHVDTIRGFNKAESGQEVLYRSNFSLTIQQFSAGIKSNLEQFAIVDIDNLVNIIMQEKGVSATTDGHTLLLKLVEVLSDFGFRGPTILEENMESQMAPEKKHYIYEFDYKPSRSFTPAWMPAIHGEELQFVFGDKWASFFLKSKGDQSTNDKLITKLIQIMWTNFARDGSPVTTITPPSTGSATGTSKTGKLSWGPYVGDGLANVLRIGLNSQEISFKNHTSARIFQKVLGRLDTFLPDRFIVG